MEKLHILITLNMLIIKILKIIFKKKAAGDSLTTAVKNFPWDFQKGGFLSESMQASIV